MRLRFRESVDDGRVGVGVDLVALEGAQRAVVEERGARRVQVDGFFGGGGALPDALEDGLDGGEVVGRCGVDDDLGARLAGVLGWMVV